MVSVDQKEHANQIKEKKEEDETELLGTSL
jgi:hypothetical protein